MAGQSVPIDTRPTHLEVLISGSTLSFLTFKLKNCHGDTEGFLYGHINTRINQEVSDMQEGIESVQKTITITDFVCFKNKFTFYDKCGRLDKVKCARVECLTRDTPANTRTVGWFSFRRNTTSGMSLREKYVHQGLWDIFSPVIDTFLHILLIETISVQLVLEQLSMCAYTYDTTPSGRHILTPHSIKILNLNVANTSKNRYKHPINTSGLTLTYSNTLDTILTPFSEQIGSKPPFLQSAQMITQISANTLERMCHMQQQILSNVKHIEKVKSEISILTHDPSYSEELIPSAPPSSILCPINKKHMEQHLPNKTAMDYNTYQHPDKIINQDPSAGLHPYNTGLFAPLELAPSHSDQPPPYTQISSGAYTGQLQIPYERSVPMDSSSTIAMGSFVNNNSNNNNNNNNNNNDNLFQTRFRFQPSNMKLNECIIVCSSEDESTA